jgi:hypothetical protein
MGDSSGQAAAFASQIYRLAASWFGKLTTP